MSKKLTLMFVALLIVLLTTAVTIIAYSKDWNQQGAVQQFDSEVWRNGDARLRGRMVDDVIRTEMLIGLSGLEVQKLLSAPESESERTYRYSVDLGTTFASHPWLYTLVVEFDATGRVSTVSLRD